MNTSHAPARPAQTFGDSFAAVKLVPTWAWFVIAVIIGPVMAWSSVSIFDAVMKLGVPWWCAWIPAAALDGVMLLMTPWSVNELLDREVQLWAKWIVFGAISGSVAVGFVDHFLNSDSLNTYMRVLAGVVGAVPNAMAALVVHVLNKVVRQQSRQAAEREQARHDAEQAKRDLAAAECNRIATKAAADAEHAEGLRRAAELLQIAERTRKTNQEALDAEREKDRIRTQRSAAVEQALSRPVPLRDVSAPKQAVKPKAVAGGGRRSDKADNARRYLIRQLRDEQRDPGSITAAEVDRAIGAVSGANNKPTGYSNRNLAGWLAEVQAFLQQTA